MSNRCKRLFTALCAIIVFLGTYANYFIPIQVNAVTNTTAPTLDLENDVKWFGRTRSDSSGHHFSWSDSGFQFTFYGTGAEATMKATLSTAGNSAQTAYIKIYVDDVLVNDVAVPETETQMTLASGLEEGLHTIKVIKRTNGYYSYVTVSKIQLNAGAEIRTTQKYFERKLLFVGDDFSIGYGAKITNAMVSAGTAPSSYSTETEDSTIGYTSLAADYFGAENMIVGLMGGSGRGIGINGAGGTSHKASDYFEYLDYRQWIGGTKVVYDHTQYDPDVVVINLGNYDEHYYSSSASESGTTVTDAEKTTFETNCKNFILRVRESYPEAKILYTYGVRYNSFVSNIKNVIDGLNKSGYRDIYFAELTRITTTGLPGKPTTEGHQNLSEDLIEAIKDVTGWVGKDELKNPVSGDVQLDSSYEPFEQTDISVMSYNVLAHNGSTQNYEAYGNRMAKVATMIKAYDPDLIGLQEVSVPYDTFTHNWPSYLSSNLTEYSSVRLDTQANNSNLMRIGNGLMIMYKKDRFELVTSGYQQYKTYTDTSAYGGKTYTVTDTSRWFHWVQLRDKTTGQVFYLYNTHLTVNGSTPAADRVSQCRILAQHIVKTNAATSCPFFITGDFNTTFDAGDGALEKLTAYNKKDDGASAVALFNDGASVADYTRFADRTGSLDHIFVANRYVDVKEFHVAIEGVDGRRTSDHSPHIAYCNFKPHTTAGLTTGLDESGKVFNASTSASTYTFNFTLGTGVTYSVYDENGTAVSGTTVTLSKRTNRFGLYFKDGKGNHVCTIQAVITNTSIAQPTVTATGSVVNQYFANGAYQILVNGDTLNLTTSAGNFYTNPYASRGEAATLALTSISGGRTVYYLKTTAGDIYPVYIYKQTATANTDSSVLYVDDDIGSASTGTVAFYDGKDVFFVSKGTKGYATVSEVAAKANTIDNCTVYFAPGNYSSNEVVFNKNVTLLGNNYDVSAVDIKTPNWSLAGRKAETVIDGGFVFENASNISVTVKGFTIEGTSPNGPIYVNDTSAVATRATHEQTLDIQNNIITGGGDGTSSSYASAVHAYSGAQVKGLIKNNYFRSTLNQDAVGNKGKTRAIAVNNTNGFVIDSNYIIGYSIVFDITDEVSSSVAGKSNYTVISNRFEHCGTARNYVKGITSSTSAVISYLDNDFVRCGGAHSIYAIYFNFNQNSLGNDCSKITINIVGNRFADCYRSLQFTRSSAAAQTGNLAEATVRVNKNSFINPVEGKWKKYFRSIDISFCVVGATANGTISPQKWNFADNHFESTFLVAEYNNLQENYDNSIYELNYMRYYSTQSAGSDSKSFIISADHFKPVSTTAASASGAFSGATGVTSDSYAYDFDNDIKNMQLIKGVSPFREKFTHTVGNSSSHIYITNDLTARMEGFAQFYSDNRWTGENQITLDLKMDSDANNFAGFYVKYGKENVSARANNIVFFENDGVRGDSANSTTGTTGIGFSFRTINNTPCIEIFVKYLNSSGQLAVSGQYFYNVVDNLNDFNTYRVTDDGAGTIKFYANNKLFATLICSNAQVPTLNTSYKEKYYSNVTIQDGNGSTLSTVSNALVSTESALAFGTRNENLEIDNIEIINEIPEDLKIDAVMLTLSNNISINYAVIKSKFDAAGFTNPKLKVVLEGTTYELKPSLTSISNIPCYLFNFDDIAPQMMNDILSATLYAESKGEIYKSATSNYSVSMYAYAQLQTTTNAKFRTLLVDMLRYGRYAQEQTSYKTYDPIDSKLTTEQAAWGTQSLRTLVDASSKPAAGSGATWVGMGLNLQNKVEIIGYFDIASTKDVTVKVTNANGNVIDTITADKFGSAIGPNGTPVVSFTFDKLAANQMSDVLGFTVYNEQGEDVSGKCFFSVESYVKKSQTTTNATFLNLINSMMKYGDSARAYASN